jgi:hypothetical protein
MAENSAESVVFIAGGATAGAGVSATVGGMGLAGSFGAVGIGMLQSQWLEQLRVLLLMELLERSQMEIRQLLVRSALVP